MCEMVHLLKIYYPKLQFNDEKNWNYFLYKRALEYNKDFVKDTSKGCLLVINQKQFLPISHILVSVPQKLNLESIAYMTSYCNSYLFLKHFACLLFLFNVCF